MAQVISFEREFLINLAPVWLACRWKLMGHQLHGWPFRSDLEYDLLGLCDYGHEMRLLANEELRRFSSEQAIDRPIGGV